MGLKNTSYLSLVVLHAVLGFVIYTLPALSLIYGLLTLVFGVFYIIKKQNQNNEALYMAAYIVGLEVFLRMTGGGISYEFGKYAVTLFMIMGVFFSGIKRGSFTYLIYILLLLPAVLVSTETLSYDTNFRKAVVFNLLGPICLGISALYCYQREVTYQQLLNVLTSFGLPIIGMIVYLFLYTPDLQESITSTGSNFATSGGFGPNQVATILGLGMFVFFVQALLNSPSKIVFYTNVALLFVCSYRGIITFSRGGVFVGIFMILLFSYFLFKRLNVRAKSKMMLLMVGTVVLGFSVWTYSSLQTEGMIDKRYANQNASGVEKESLLTGRETLMAAELQMFLDNPLLGVGVGRNKEIRQEETGINLVSHSETTRLLAEHGMLGIFALLILIFMPLSLYMSNKQNMFLLCFFVFWALTINHAAMRLAAPAFVYALSLLKVTFDEKNPPLHREQTL